MKTKTRFIGAARLCDPYNDGTQELWAIFFVVTYTQGVYGPSKGSAMDAALPITIDDEAPVLDGRAYISFSDSTHPRAPERPASATSARP